MKADPGEVTLLLRAMHEGDSGAADRMMPLIYAELWRIARAYMRRERPDHTLQPTALIHEAYLRLVGEDVAWNSRAHFIGVAAHVMRQVLVDYARAHQAERRAGRMRRIEMQEDLAVSPNHLEEILSLDQALSHLASPHARRAHIVELRYFGGLSVEAIAAIVGVAPRSVKRDFALARIALARDLLLAPASAPGPGLRR